MTATFSAIIAVVVSAFTTVSHGLAGMIAGQSFTTTVTVSVAGVT